MKFCKPGFTLIEVIVVIALVSILTAVVLTSFGKSRTTKTVEAEASAFARIVREAQNYAVTGRQTGTDEIPCWFTVLPTGASPLSNYRLSVRYHNGSEDVCTLSSPTKDLGMYPIQNGVEFKSTGWTWVRYQVPFGKFVTGNSAIPVVFVKDGVEYTVCAYPSGNVNVVAGESDCSSP